MAHDPWVMGHVFDGSRGSWVTLYDPFAALVRTGLPDLGGSTVASLAASEFIP